MLHSSLSVSTVALCLVLLLVSVVVPSFAYEWGPNPVEPNGDGPKYPAFSFEHDTMYINDINLRTTSGSSAVDYPISINSPSLPLPNWSTRNDPHIGGRLPANTRQFQYPMGMPFDGLRVETDLAAISAQGDSFSSLTFSIWIKFKQFNQDWIQEPPGYRVVALKQPKGTQDLQAYNVGGFASTTIPGDGDGIYYMARYPSGALTTDMQTITADGAPYTWQVAGGLMASVGVQTNDAQAFELKDLSLTRGAYVRMALLATSGAPVPSSRVQLTPAQLSVEVFNSQDASVAIDQATLRVDISDADQASYVPGTAKLYYRSASQTNNEWRPVASSSISEGVATAPLSASIVSSNSEVTYFSVQAEASGAVSPPVPSSSSSSTGGVSSSSSSAGPSSSSSSSVSSSTGPSSSSSSSSSTGPSSSSSSSSTASSSSTGKVKPSSSSTGVSSTAESSTVQASSTGGGSSSSDSSSADSSSTVPSSTTNPAVPSSSSGDSSADSSSVGISSSSDFASADSSSSSGSSDSVTSSSTASPDSSSSTNPLDGFSSSSSSSTGILEPINLIDAAAHVDGRTVTLFAVISASIAMVLAHHM